MFGWNVTHETSPVGSMSALFNIIILILFLVLFLLDLGAIRLNQKRHKQNKHVRDSHTNLGNTRSGEDSVRPAPEQTLVNVDKQRTDLYN